MNDNPKLKPLFHVLLQLPAIELSALHETIHADIEDDGMWSVHFQLDTKHPLAWRVVQEFGFAINYITTRDDLSAVFRPVSPAPYLNGGVKYLAWRLENKDPEYTPASCAETLLREFPKPLRNHAAWDYDKRFRE